MSVRRLGDAIADPVDGQDVVPADRTPVDVSIPEPGPALDDREEALDPGTVWFAVACGVLLVVPLALGSGVTAGCAYLLSVAVALLGNVALRRTAWSFLPWAVSYGLLPAFLSYGGWGGQADGDPPTEVMTVLAALLGVAVHVLLALPDLVDDNADGLRHLPLRLALRTGAPRLMVVTIVVTVFLAASIVVAGLTVGLRQ